MKALRTFGPLTAFILCHRLVAGSLDVTVKDANGVFVADAVVYTNLANSVASPAKKRIVIDQRDKQFVPYVTALQVGTAVMFPNSDNIRHHVYSFSLAKKFELPLYAGVPTEPVLFDKVGFVTLGCNIHDWMIAYVAVLPTPYFQVTAREGHVTLKNLAAGTYVVHAWQPCMKEPPEKLAQQVEVPANGAKDLLFTLDLKPDFRARRAPGLSNGGYR